MVQVALEGEVFDLEGPEADIYFWAVGAGVVEMGFLAAAFRELQPPQATALDIGANVGLATLLMNRLRPDGEVLAVEPSASTFGFLQRNLSAAGGRVAALQVALGRQDGAYDWVEDRGNSAASHLSLRAHPGADATPVMTLDGLVQARGLSPAFIKIDVEGFELDVLEGGERTLRDHRPVVFLELNSFTTIVYGDRNPKALIAFLLQRFERVFWSQRGELRELRSEGSIVDLLHKQITSGACLDDLLCIPAGRTFDESRLPGAWTAEEAVDPRDVEIADLTDRLQMLQAEHTSVTTSRTWRSAIALRRMLARAGI